MGLEDRDILYEKRGEELSRSLHMLRRKFRKLYPSGYRSPKTSAMRTETIRGRGNQLYVRNNGFSKGVMLTGENLAGNVCFGRDTPVAFPQFACAVFLPLAHAYGCAFDMLTLLPWGHMSLCYVRLLLRAYF